MRQRIYQRIPFWGWAVAVGCLLIKFFSAGIGFYSNSIFLLPLQAEFGTPRTTISQGFALVGLIAGLLMPLVGVIVDRWGPRFSLLTGVIGSLSIFFLLSRMTELWHFYALVVVQGFIFPFVGLLPGQALIGRWFVRRRGRAMGLMMAGIGLGGLVMPPVNGWIIELAGWRTAYVVGAILMAGIALPAALFLLRDDPAQLGQHPDGSSEPPTVFQSASGGVSLPEALHSWAFWALTMAAGLIMGCIGLMSLHVPAMLQDAGLSLSQAGVFLGLTMGFSVVGRLSIGGLADRLDPRLVLGAIAALMGVGALNMLAPASPLARVAYVVMFGIGLGGSATAVPLVMQAVFGMGSFGRIYGLTNVVMALAMALGNYLGGWVYDTWGGYVYAVWGVFAAGLAAGLLTLSIGRIAHSSP